MALKRSSSIHQGKLDASGNEPSSSSSSSPGGKLTQNIHNYFIDLADWVSQVGHVCQMLGVCWAGEGGRQWTSISSGLRGEGGL